LGHRYVEFATLFDEVKGAFNVSVEKGLKVFRVFSVVREVLLNPTLDVGSPLVPVIVGNVKNTGSRACSGSGKSKISNFKNSSH
jgi:hypothetical protein